METRIELYREAGMGSGQVAIDELPDFMSTTDDLLHHDMPMLVSVGEMESFDPYSLRRGLRAAGIEIANLEAFMLSDAKKRELQPHMRNLTRPLLQYVFSASNIELSDPEMLRDRLLNANSSTVLQRINGLASALETSREDLPDLLEDYGDVFLSLGFYKQYLAEIGPRIALLRDWVKEAYQVPHIGKDPMTGPALLKTERILGALHQSLKRRFSNFENKTDIRWERVTVGTFNQVRALIADHQASLAAVLCGLTVKVSEWEARFPGGGGSFERRADFVLSDLRSGLDRMTAIEREASTFE
ncbi:hypothetical protein [Nisaea nitritireducens]|uniref:hypothetical protein n=1 Tax=Nisaea nitritireducens TaxID=568392 RepID=UPI0018689AEC|nr:hypothetical protein [Nisaea nitritireducens]